MDIVNVCRDEQEVRMGFHPKCVSYTKPTGSEGCVSSYFGSEVVHVSVNDTWTVF